ncbi:HlyD family secretion protein [Paludisphaera soli]|uniref:HlyD family secretion protein n=1 Tax=Paludisphaera soli TaxID=2712865 RepID=UPI0013EA5867|nr:HlyD family efflux transporter periplasmic adaptor subunit [Paludisphaera soli]
MDDHRPAVAEAPGDVELRRRLEEAEEALRAIRDGEVDALIVETPDGIQLRPLWIRVWPRRLLRLAFGLTLLGAAAWFAIFAYLYRGSVQAAITAPLVAVAVPVQGRVRGTPPAVGETVVAGQALFIVQPPPADRRPSERLRAEIAAVRHTVSALNVEIGDLDRLKDSLRSHFEEYRDLRIRHAETLAAERGAHADAVASGLRSSEAEARSLGLLSRKSQTSGLELGQAEIDVERNRHELNVARQAAARSDLQLAAARKGLFLGEGDGGQDRVNSEQRGDDIEIQQAALRARVSELEGELGELAARILSEDAYLSTHDAQTVSAPVGGVVWASTVSDASEVSPGSVAMEILDPGRLMLEATFSKSDLARVHPGQPIQARLLGSSEVVKGRVVRLAGSHETEPAPGGAAALIPRTPDTYRAIIALDRQPEGGSAANCFHVGRSAYVWIAR